jgi:hypothetical protein
MYLMQVVVGCRPRRDRRCREAGFYESATGKKYRRVQLLTIEGLLSGQPLSHPSA